MGMSTGGKIGTAANTCADFCILKIHVSLDRRQRDVLRMHNLCVLYINSKKKHDLFFTTLPYQKAHMHGHFAPLGVPCPVYDHDGYCRDVV